MDAHHDPRETPDTAAPAATYRDALRRCDGLELQSLARQAGGLRAALYTSPPYDLAVPPLALPRLSITLTSAPVHGALDGDRPRDWRTPRHALFLTPAGAAARWRKAAPSRHINLYFDATTLHDETPALGRRLGEAPLLNLRLPGLGALADALVQELAHPQPWAAEAADSLGRLILVRLARHLSGSARGSPALSPAVLQRVHEHVQAHLAQRILVADLARVAGLSPHHFAHAYTRSTGRSPHQAVLDARVRQALALLRHTAQPLSEVALSAGFASQQHLSRVLRQRTGQTPAQLRRRGGAL